MTPIGQNVKRLRVAAGLTQMGLATSAGLNLSIVAQIEQGANADPRGSTLMVLARALGVTVDELLTTPDEAEEGKRPKAEPAKKGRKKRKATEPDENRDVGGEG